LCGHILKILENYVKGVGVGLRWFSHIRSLSLNVLNAAFINGIFLGESSIQKCTAFKKLCIFKNLPNFLSATGEVQKVICDLSTYPN